MTAIERWAIGLFLSALAIGGAITYHYAAVASAEKAALKKGRDEVQARWDAEKLAAAELERATKAQAAQDLKELLDEANRKTILAEADVAALRATGDRMRERIATLAAQARAGKAAGTAQGGASADTAIDLLANLCTGSEEDARVIAEYADKARSAGELCERSYGILNPEPEHLDIDSKAEPAQH